MVLWKGQAQEASSIFGKFDAFNLSNIFEYMDEVTFEKVAKKLLESATPDVRFAYWNLMVPRRMTSLFSRQVSSVDNASLAVDKGFFYRGFVVEAMARVLKTT